MWGLKKQKNIFFFFLFQINKASPSLWPCLAPQTTTIWSCLIEFNSQLFASCIIF